MEKFEDANRSDCHLANIKKCIELCTIPHDFAFSAVIEGWLRKEDEQKMNLKLEASKQFQRFGQYMKVQEAAVANTNENPTTFNEIVILNEHSINWVNVKESLNNYIAAARLSFVYKDREKQSREINIQVNRLSKLIVKKHPKPGCEDKLRQQLAIFHLLKQSLCPYIQKAYYSSQTKFKDNLFSDFYKLSSLDSFLSQSKSYTSLTTRLLLVCSLIIGIRYLHSNDILHLDVKSNNLLIGHGLILRISDFGEAYHNSVCPQNYRPGFTLQYSSPQYFQNPPTFGEKSDVYGLGATIYEILFDHNPFQIMNLNQNALKVNLTNKTYSHYIKFATQHTSVFGPSVLMQMLLELAVKCLNPDPQCRPRLQWCLVVFREALQYVLKWDNYYSSINY